jgi:hypothetical protein
MPVSATPEHGSPSAAIEPAAEPRAPQRSTGGVMSRASFVLWLAISVTASRYDGGYRFENGSDDDI